MAARLSRRELAQYVASQLAEGSKDVLMQLAAYLIETRRQSEAALLAREIEQALAEHGVLVIDIVSAHDLGQALLDEVTKMAAAPYNAQDIQVRACVDPSLIGGVRIHTPDAEYDGTIRRKLTKLQAIKV